MYSIPWKEILTLGVVPLVKWIVQYSSERREERIKEEEEKAKEEEAAAIKARLEQRILEARKNQKWKDIDPSKYDV